MNIKIIYEEDTELAEYEALSKGYRADVTVVIGDKKYKVYIISMLRLQQDFEIEHQDYGYYVDEPNTLIVKEVTKKEIEYVIYEMHKCKYFERLDNNGF
ncbi:MAG: hypothetical protein ACI4GW_00460 [Lachnospiraceae bacterium]